jgi:hypothetical protein
MNQISTLNIIASCVTILAFVFAIWQYTQNKRIKHLITLEAIELHRNIALALGAIQSASKNLKNPDVLSHEIGRTEGICNSILHESAKLYCNLSDTRVDDIDDLIKFNQLNESYRHIYYGYSKNRRGFLREKLKRIISFF